MVLLEASKDRITKDPIALVIRDRVSGDELNNANENRANGFCSCEPSRVAAIDETIARPFIPRGEHFIPRKEHIPSPAYGWISL